jgi:hypothetical protein
VADRTIERRLRSLEAPDEAHAGARAWEVVAAGYEQLERAPAARRRITPRALALVAAALCLAALAISPAGAGVVHWVGDRFAGTPGVRNARPALVSLPAPGRLLVSSRDGAWVVPRHGARRLLGPYRDAAWSPHGLFVAGVRGRSLMAVDTLGHVHWALTRPTPPRHPSWSPVDGFRVAYLSGHTLRVVAGDGTGDRLLAAGVAPVAPVWRPGPGHVLSYVTAAGAVRTRRVDGGHTLWRTGAGSPTPLALEWSPRGDAVLVLRQSSVELLSGRSGQVQKTFGLRAGTRAVAADISPDGRTIALVRYRERARRSDVLLLSVRSSGWHPRSAFPGAGRYGGVRWSPNGRWLLVTWPAADQWVFLRSSAVRGLVAVSHIGRAFEPDRRGAARFPAAGGWCCG